MIALAGRSYLGVAGRRYVGTRAMERDRFLYWGSGSHPCWRVMIVLEEKGLPYKEKLLEFSQSLSLDRPIVSSICSIGEHKSPEVMALNPRGQLPTFKDGESLVNESGAILMYLESQYPEKPLLPADPVQKAKVLQRFFETLVTDVKLRNFTYPKRKEMDNPLEQQHLEEAKAEFALWESYLGTQTYAATDDFTLADAMFAPFLLVMERFGMTFKDYPNMKKYCAMIKDRPSVAKTSPPHWRESKPPHAFMNIF